MKKIIVWGILVMSIHKILPTSTKTQPLDLNAHVLVRW
jgi:hypothetical protein